MFSERGYGHGDFSFAAQHAQIGGICTCKFLQRSQIVTVGSNHNIGIQIRCRIVESLSQSGSAIKRLSHRKAFSVAELFPGFGHLYPESQRHRCFRDGKIYVAASGKEHSRRSSDYIDTNTQSAAAFHACGMFTVRKKSS